MPNEPLSDDAAETLVRATQREVRSFIAGIGVPIDAVGDVAQDVYLRHLADPGRLPENVAELAWLKGIARNCALQWFRSRRAQGAALAEVALGLSTAPETPANAEDELRALRSCVESVPERGRKLLDWCYGEGCAAEELARRAGTSIETVRNTLYRLRGSLRDCVNRRLAGEGSA